MVTKVRLVVQPGGNGSELWIDGRKMDNVLSVTLSEVTIDTPVILTVVFASIEAEIEGDVAGVLSVARVPA